jgi:hypothetical protein
MNYKVTAEDALKQLMEQSEFPFTVMMKHGSMTIEYFAPKEVDTQTQHKQDEIYSSMGIALYRNGEKVLCKKRCPVCSCRYGTSLENFSDDFAVWVIFMDPSGEENNYSGDCELVFIRYNLCQQTSQP